MTNKVIYKLKGHEKFPLREGWINKGLSVAKEKGTHIFLESQGPDMLGVGTNMVKSIRYWMQACGLLVKDGNKEILSDMAEIIYMNDPYLEDIFSLWILHSNITKNIEQATVWYMFFNRFNVDSFNKADMQKKMQQELFNYVGQQVTESSLKDDIDVLLNMYSKGDNKNEDPEDKIISPFSTLGIIKKEDETYYKIQPDLRRIANELVLYEISSLLDHNKSISIETIASGERTGKIRMLKTLAVINIINKFDEMPPTEEILKIASGLPNASEILNSLVAKELIYKKETNNCYVFKTRAGASLKSEIKRRRVLKDSVNLSQVFSDVSNNQYILPKRYNNTYSMTRYFRFEYLDVVDFLKLENVDVLLRDGKFQDGKVVALYSLDNSNRTEQIMKKVAELTSYNIIVIYAEKPFAMMDKARDYEIIQNIKSDDKFMKENEILSKELVVMEEDIEKILSNYLENEFEQMGSHITIYYDGDKWVLDENICTSIAVDIVCNHFYSETVVINNELINKQYIKTAPIKKSRKIIMQNILDEGSVESYLSGTSSEATIYRAVMVNSGISSDDKPDNVKKLLGIFKSFFDSCVDEKKSLSILVNRFCGKPFGIYFTS